MSPASRGPDPHFHQTFAETFCVEEGAVDIFADGAWHRVTAGGRVHARAGDVHAVKKHNDEAASLLMVLTPGVPREDYFTELVACAEDDLEALHATHDNHFV